MKTHLLLIFVFLSACTHTHKASSPDKKQCREVAQAGTSCHQVFQLPALNPQQTDVKDKILVLLNEPANWPKVTKGIDSLLPAIEKLSSQGQLKPMLLVVAQKALEMGKLPERITQENLTETVDQLVDMIDNQFIAKGLSSKNPQKYVSWLAASRNLRKMALKTTVPPRGPGQESAFKNPAFIKELETVAGSPFKPASTVKLLANGPESFPLREKLIQNAKSSVYVMSWAIENDTTGWLFAKLLNKKFKEGVDVRVIVDKKTAQQSIYGTVPSWLQQQGVPTILWKDPSMPMYAFHKKILVVDGQHVIGGGMNFGDVYSHMGPEKTPRWRDTDFYAQGDVATDSTSVFTQDWNSQIEKNNLSYSRLPVLAKPRTSSVKAEKQVPILLIDLVPNPQVHDPILVSIIKGIEGATKEINIENAYFIESPALQLSLLNALKRGVKVNIFTNSPTSIDVAIISNPILKALQIYQHHGARIYLKNGPTVHSKFMTVDGEASWVMSYNHHPQSMRIQNENAYVILDSTFTHQLDQHFAQGLANEATAVTTAQQLQVKESLLDIILQRYFFDQL